MRTVITGGNGFAGRWLRAWLDRSGDEVFTPLVDVTDPKAVSDALTEAAPDVIFHLAAISVPAQASADPDRAMAVNAWGTRHVLAAAAAMQRPPVVLVTSSAAVYAPSANPITEEATPRSDGAYIRSKLAAEEACAEASANGAHVIVIRPFNHTGPGQTADMVVPALASAVLGALSRGEEFVSAGNLDVRRDIGDVRDVVRAYRLMAEKAPAGTYNVCTGRSVLLRDLAERLAILAGAPDLEFRIDPARKRADDPPLVVGDHSKLAGATGWQPEIDIDTTLADVLAWWAART